MSNQEKQFYPPYSQTFCHNFAASSGSSAGNATIGVLLTGGGVLGTLAYQSIVRKDSTKATSGSNQSVSENQDD